MGLLTQAKPNVVSTNLVQYNLMLTGDTGVGKTYSMYKWLKKLSGDKEPVFLMFEDRYQHIDGIMAVRIRSISDLKSVIADLKNPKLKEQFSCVVIDTIDKYEELMEKAVTDASNVDIIREVGAYGLGTVKYKSKLRYINEIQSLGYPVHTIAQSKTSYDLDSKEYNISLGINKNTTRYVTAMAYCIGYLFKNGNDRYITFANDNNGKVCFTNERTRINYLKDSFNLAEIINVNDFTSELEKGVKSISSNTVDTNTIQVVVEKEDFKSLMERGLNLGNTLYANGCQGEVNRILIENLGTDENNNPIMFNNLNETQYDIAKVIVDDFTQLAVSKGLIQEEE